MKLSTRARYALRAMIHIARHSKDGMPVKLADAAQQTGISHRYLEQVAISLKNAKLLKGISGKSGGHVLTRPAHQIRLAEIVEAEIGPISVVDCVLDTESCIRKEGCECHELYCLLNERITDTLNEYTLADLEQGRVNRSAVLKKQ